MYAVIKTGGKQYRVAKDDVVTIERIKAQPGEAISFGEVLMLSGAASDTAIGTPFIAGAKVTAEVLELNRGEKLIAFKKRRRKNSRRKKGHRQDLMTVRIMEVLTAGQQASVKPSGVGVKATAAAGAMAGAGASARVSGKSSVTGKASATAGRAFVALKSAEGGKADDLSLIGGVGPKMEAELHKAGIFHFWQLAGMTTADIAKLEATGEIGPRVSREEWIPQAQELLDGKPPRAKTDRDRAGS